MSAETFAARFDRVYDGDTVHLDILLAVSEVFHQEFWRLGFRYRMARCNAPELATPEGKAAAAALTTLCAGFPVLGWSISTSKPDPYGGTSLR